VARPVAVDTGPTSVFFYSFFFMAGVRVLPAPRFFFWRLNGRSGTEIFLIGGRWLKKKKMALVLIEFSGVSLHGE
jgi:hypothetical protein